MFRGSLNIMWCNLLLQISYEKCDSELEELEAPSCHHMLQLIFLFWEVKVVHFLLRLFQGVCVIGLHARQGNEMIQGIKSRSYSLPLYMHFKVTPFLKCLRSNRILFVTLFNRTLYQMGEPGQPEVHPILFPRSQLSGKAPVVKFDQVL